MSATWFAIIVLYVGLLALCVAVLAIARQVGVLLERISPMGALINDSGPTVGDASPQFQLESLNGGVVRLGAPSGRCTLVFFLSPTCPVCKRLLPVLQSLRSAEESWLDIVLASDGPNEEHVSLIYHERLRDFPYVLSKSLGLSYRVARLPYAVLLDQSGNIRSKGLVNSREQIESLFNAHEMNVPSVQDYLNASPKTEVSDRETLELNP